MSGKSVAATAKNMVVIGAGHNGMVAACYLAKAGHKVTVLEAYHSTGGMSATNAIFPEAPQHLVNEGGLDVTLLRCSHIIKELELEKFGLAQVVPDPPYAFLQPDGSSLCIWRDPVKTADEIRYFSPKDAKAYLEFVSSISLMMEGVLPFMRSHPYRLNIFDMAFGLLKMLMHPTKLWGMTRFLSSTHAEYIEEHFESEMVRGPLASMVPFLPPRMEATGWALIYYAVIHGIGVSRIVGGSGGLTDALARCLHAHGGSIRTSARVQKIIVENERTRGVELVSGERIHADVVVSAMNVKLTLQDLLPQGTLPHKAQVQANNIPVCNHRASSFKIDVAMREQVRMTRHQAWRKQHLGDSTDLRLPGHCSVTFEQYLRGWDDCAAGRLPNPLHNFAIFPAHADPSQAPPGQDVLWYWGGVAPTHPTEPWSTLKERAAKEAYQYLGQFYDDIEGIEIARRVMSPDDIAERYNVPFGHVYHVDTAMSRFGPFRPSPIFADYTTPVCGLFLSGASMHPCAGIAGIPGQLAAKTVLRKTRNWT